MGEFKRVLGRNIKKDLKYPIGAFDIETVPFDKKGTSLYGKYADGFLKYEDDETFYRCPTVESLWERIIARKNVILYAHNIEYESNYLIDVIPEDQKMQVILQGDTHIIGFILYFEDGVIELRDSMALVPMSLGDATKAFKTTSKGDIGLKKGQIYNPDNPVHQEYCRNDVRCTIEVVNKVRDLQREVFGCGIGWTAASTAMAAWRSTIPKGVKYHRMSESRENFCRSGYYGGFVYPGRDSHKHGYTISNDRNAAYAACMKQAFPVGKGRTVVEFEEGKLGIYDVKVYNDGKFPVLPYKQNGQLMWPQGSFRTTVTSEEIEYARSLGIEVEIVIGMVWDKVEYPFLEFIEKCEYLEYNFPEMKAFIKLLRNALYGKFGSKLMVFEACVTDDILEGWTALVNPKTGYVNFRLWTREKINDAEYVQPHWAAFVTARERIWLFEIIHTIGVEFVYYCDTDSVKADGYRVEQCMKEGLFEVADKKYGACKVDEEYEWFQCLGLKMYHGELTDEYYQKMLEKDKDTKKMKMRAKGISGKYLSTQLFEDAYEGVYKEVKFSEGAANSTFVRMKRGLPMRREVARKMTNRFNSKAWDFRPDGSVHPIVLK